MRHGIRRVLLALISAALAVAGCEAIVPGDVPTYACVAGTGACPSGMVCVAATGSCIARDAVCSLLACGGGSTCDPDNAVCTGGVAPPDSGPAQNDAASADVTVTVNDAQGGVVDSALPDTDAPITGPCRDIGCRCAGASDCNSGICGDALTLTTDVVGATQSNVCTKPCCTSSDCGAGAACFGAANGGNYCVRSEILGRARSTQMKAAGATCGAPAECASGLCTGGLCVDTCCTATACAAGTQCAFARFAGATTFDRHYTFSCQVTSASGVQGASCQNASDCKSGVCEATCGFCSTSCLAPCRNSAECGSGYLCADVSVSTQTSTNDVAVNCYAATGNGTKTLGATCASDGECRSGSCDTKLKACVDVCFGDSDCAGGPAGWRCRPTILTVNGGGSFSVLGCGP